MVKVLEEGIVETSRVSTYFAISSTDQATERQYLMTLKEFRIQLAIGAFRDDTEIFAIAEDENTPDDLLQYLVNYGSRLQSFNGSNFSSMAAYTLQQKMMC